MSLDPKSEYYDVGGIETIKIIRAKLTPDQFQGYLLGNIIKYGCRVNFKGARLGDRRRDIEKLAQYARMLLEEMKMESHASTDKTGNIDWVSPR